MARAPAHWRPFLIGLAAAQLNFIIVVFFASYVSDEAISALTYAFLIAMLPVGVLGMAISTAVFPTLAQQADCPARHQYGPDQSHHGVQPAQAQPPPPEQGQDGQHGGGGVGNHMQACRIQVQVALGRMRPVTVFVPVVTIEIVVMIVPVVVVIAPSFAERYLSTALLLVEPA